MITNLLKPLGKYTFECGFIFPNSLIRSSVLYGAEAMYNITEKELRELERIEENQINKIFLKQKQGYRFHYISCTLMQDKCLQGTRSKDIN